MNYEEKRITVNKERKNVWGGNKTKAPVLINHKSVGIGL